LFVVAGYKPSAHRFLVFRGSGVVLEQREKVEPTINALSSSSLDLVSPEVKITISGEVTKVHDESDKAKMRFLSANRTDGLRVQRYE
jgi:hypothetical protein